ncbi:MAG: TetR/AcrR family transcriptional regulator [Lachnospirales bacterium]
MYNGKNKTALLSQKLITEAFLTLLEKNKLSKVTVSEICKKAGVSRQTFYSLFKSKENLINYEYNRRNIQLYDYFNDKENVKMEDIIVAFSSFLFDNKKFFKILVENDMLCLINDAIQINLASYNNFLPKNEDLKNAYALSFISGGLTEITRIYILNENPPKLELIESFLIDLFNGNYLL